MAQDESVKRLFIVNVITTIGTHFKGDGMDDKDVEAFKTQLEKDKTVFSSTSEEEIKKRISQGVAENMTMTGIYWSMHRKIDDVAVKALLINLIRLVAN